MPDPFIIYPLSEEITSWIESIALKSTATKALLEVHEPSR